MNTIIMRILHHYDAEARERGTGCRTIAPVNDVL